MRPIRLTKGEAEELCQIMTAGNSALKRCAEMMGLKHTMFRGQLFKGTLDTSKLTPEQKQTLDAAIPLIMEVRDKCETKMRAAFYRMIVRQARAAAANNFDPHEAYEEFMQEGEMGILDATYSYETEKGTTLLTYVWRCVRRKIVACINRLNPLCPLTNEALDIIRRVEEEREKHDGNISDDEVVEAIGLTEEERTIFFRSTTKVINEALASDTDEETHEDDYTGSRSGVDRDFKEVFYIRKDARQAVKDADLDELELACLLTELFPYHGWKEDVAKTHVNERTGDRYTRQNIQYVLERAKKKVKEAYVNPPKVHKENPSVDKFFDEWEGQGEK